MDEASQPPNGVPSAVWRWICDELGDGPARTVDPLVGVVVTAARSADRGEAQSTPDEVLRYWAWFLDDARRIVHQNEREFIRYARAAAWSDEGIRSWALLDEDRTVDEHLAQLNGLVHRTNRPPAPNG